MYLIGGSHGPASDPGEAMGSKKGVRECFFDIIARVLGNAEINFFKVRFQKPK